MTWEIVLYFFAYPQRLMVLLFKLVWCFPNVEEGTFPAGAIRICREGRGLLVEFYLVALHILLQMFHKLYKILTPHLNQFLCPTT